MRTIDNCRADFPIFNQENNEKRIVYLDNAATTQKPNQVIDTIKDYYESINANPHRGAHQWSIQATEAYENVREQVKQFINAGKREEIIFTRNATEALNLVAYSYVFNFLEEEDEILVGISEHHSNVLPWQYIAKLKNLRIKYILTDEQGNILVEEVKNKITSRTKFLTIAHMNNTLGNINPVKDIIAYAHNYNIVVCVDGAQSTPHMKIDVQQLDADFYCFSGHKMLGPMGSGVLYGKKKILEKMPPFLYGGNMVEYAETNQSSFAPLPQKFEAGTQNVAEVLGLGSAIRYLEEVGLDSIRKHEQQLVEYALNQMEKLPYVIIYGPTDSKIKGGVITFNIEGVHAHDTSSILDHYGIAIRAGHHCAQPFMKHLGINASCRASFYLYNTKEDVDIFIKGLKNVRRWLGYGS